MTFFLSPCKKIPPKFGEPNRSWMTPSQKTPQKTLKKPLKDSQKTLKNLQKTRNKTKK
jgi:hypothetical protein